MKIPLELDHKEAWALAQFCKALTYDTALHYQGTRELPHEGAHELMDAIAKTAEALRVAGYSPR